MNRVWEIPLLATIKRKKERKTMTVQDRIVKNKMSLLDLMGVNCNYAPIRPC